MLMKIIRNIFTFKTMLILFGIIMSLIVSFLLWIIIAQRSENYYGILKKHAIEDVNFIVAYHNYNGTDCIDDTYKSYSSHLDEFVHEVKGNPSILFHKNIKMNTINYINDDNIIDIIKLLNNSKCTQVVDLGFTYCDIDSIKKICDIEFSHIKSISLRGSFDTEKIISMNKSGDLKCLYKMQKVIEKITSDYHTDSLILTK